MQHQTNKKKKMKDSWISGEKNKTDASWKFLFSPEDRFLSSVFYQYLLVEFSSMRVKWSGALTLAKLSTDTL